MKKPVLSLNVIAGVVFCVFSFAFAQNAQNPQQDSITITTYYPSPYGSYGQLQLYPQKTEPDKVSCNSATEGSMYYWRDPGNPLKMFVKVCDGNGNWKPIAGNWNILDGTQHIVNTNDGYVGIGTKDIEPRAQLEVMAEGDGILVTSAKSAGNSYALAVNSGNTPLLHVANNGNVGIGGADPQSKLDVRGGVRIGADNNASDTCVLDKAGTVRYKDTDGTMQYCNGKTLKWQEFGGGGTLGQPDFDSGWLDFPGTGKTADLVFNAPGTGDNKFGKRNITGKDPGKMLVFLQFDGTGSVYCPSLGINNYGYGAMWGTTGSYGSAYYYDLTSTGVKVQEAPGFDYVGKIRAYIWAWD